jgi:hypothetical protein
MQELQEMPNTQNELVPWVLTGVVSVIGALSTALVYVFRKTEFDNAKAIENLERDKVEMKAEIKTITEKADKCDEDRHVLFAQNEVMKAKMNVLESKMQRIDSKGTQYQHDREANE